jgi:hypothetical protein
VRAVPGGGPLRRLAPALALGVALFAGRPLAAQFPQDSVLPDSLLRDTVNTTARYLEAQEALNVRLPVLPHIRSEAPLPPMSRIVLDRDSLDWAMAETLGDLLQRVPGVYLWRGGWVGRTEYPNYRGRGPSSVEYTLDGMPYLPLGTDSVGVDPSFFSLSLFERVEIERWPGLLRVHLFTRRHRLKAPGSRIGISAGDKEIARYIGALERRYRSGIGFGLGGERMVAPTATGTASDFDITNVWLQLGYVPNDRLGFQAQVINSSPDRKRFIDQLDTLELAVRGRRQDVELRAFWRSRSEDQGLRVDLLFGRTHWDGQGIDDEIRQGGVQVSYRTPTFGASVRALNRSRFSPWDFRAEAGWTPLDGVSAAAEAGYTTHDLDRESRWVGLRGGLRLPLGFTMAGALRSGDFVATPTFYQQEAQSLTDWQASLAWQKPWAGVEVGYGRTAAFTPTPYRPFLPIIATLAPVAETEWVTVNWRLRPKQWFTLEGWYSDPRGGRTPDGVPATHSITSATIRSKFWRTFRSGIFDFKAQLAYETWGDGIIGRDSLTNPIALDGASFWRTNIEIRLDQFMLYWDRYNLAASRKSYVPGFRVLNFGSTFGVRWEFTN